MGNFIITQPWELFELIFILLVLFINYMIWDLRRINLLVRFYFMRDKIITSIKNIKSVVIILFQIGDPLSFVMGMPLSVVIKKLIFKKQSFGRWNGIQSSMDKEDLGQEILEICMLLMEPINHLE